MLVAPRSCCRTQIVACAAINVAQTDNISLQFLDSGSHTSLCLIVRKYGDDCGDHEDRHIARVARAIPAQTFPDVMVKMVAAMSSHQSKIRGTQRPYVVPGGCEHPRMRADSVREVFGPIPAQGAPRRRGRGAGDPTDRFGLRITGRRNPTISAELISQRADEYGSLQQKMLYTDDTETIF